MTLSITDHAGIAILALNRPPVNALDLAMILALEQSFLGLHQRPPKALIVTGSGNAFCAGVDTKAYAGYTPADRRELVLAITRMVAALYTLDVPTIACLNGHAL